MVQTDWEKVASAANFKTPKYARDQWTIVKTKLCGGKSSDDAASTPNTPTKRKAGKTSESRKRKKRNGKTFCNLYDDSGFANG